MFRKLVSNLSFSPALVGQLSFYAKRLRQEEATRRLGVIFTVFALIVQSLVVFQPPESANAANASDFVRGGVSSLNEFLRLYDQNHRNLKDIFDYAGITRAEIAAMKPAKINSKQGDLSWGRTARFSRAQGEVKHTVSTRGGGSTTVYSRPLKLWDSKPYTIKNGSTYDGWRGTSKKAGSFGLLKHCANLLTKTTPPPPPPPTCPPGQIGTPPNCTIPPQPEAACSSLSVAPLSRTSVRLTATASSANGAGIHGYTYEITDSNGKRVANRTVKSTSKSNNQSFDLKDSGRYTAKVTIDTSVGKRTSSNCAKPFVIEEPEKCPLNPELTVEDPECQPCPGDSSLWVKDEDCSEQVIIQKEAMNISQDNTDATATTAQASDRITYTLAIENIGNMPASDVKIEEQLDDVLEYARIVDAGGGQFSEETSSLSWDPINLAAKEKQTRVFTVQLASTIPSTARGQSDRTSYDCIMTNTFGNTLNIDVECPPEKVIEQVVAELPQTGLGANMLFAGLILSVVTYFYARSRQLRTEVRLIRKNLNAGSL